ncbi:unnamed protein product [Lathyrus oleraceus]
MLHLVTCTLFADKSRVYIDAQYSWLFSRLKHISWTWGCGALIIIYAAFGVVTAFETKQLAGYLMQHTSADSPWAKRWKARQAHPDGVAEYRRRFDALTIYDVIWTPYTSQRVYCEFDESSLFSGYIRWETLVARHLPERCMCQHVYVQDIPRTVPIVPASGINRWFQSNIINYVRVTIDSALRVQHDVQFEDGYLERYLTLSHRHIISPVEHVNVDVVPSVVGGPSDDVPPPPLGVNDHQHLQMIVAIMDNLMGLINPNGEVFT